MFTVSVIATALVASSSSSAAPVKPELTASAGVEAPSQDGTFTLRWSVPPDAGDQPAAYEVDLDVSGTGSGYTSWYRGAKTQSFVSGMPDGVVRIRARARSDDGAWSDWSEISVRIQHHSMTKALWLMGVGFVVFILIAAYIVWMTARRSGRS